MASRIPQEFLAQLLGRTDIVELIDSRVTLRKSGRNYQACCPFHNEKTPSFTVSPDKQFYHCFGCGAHGNAISFLIDYDRLEFREAVAELAQRAGLELPQQTDAEPAAGANLVLLMARAERFYRHQLRAHPQRQRAIDYLRDRGLDGVTVRDFGLGYAPPGWDNLLRALADDETRPQDLISAGLVIARDSGGSYDRFRDRIMFPIRDRRGRTIAFGGRTLDDATPKYLNSSETPLFHKGRELYGLFEARQHNRELTRLLVVEGYMDVIALAQHGIHYAVATLGTATTADHLERLFRLTDQLVFCFDGDRAGREAAWRALEQTLPQLRDGRRVHYLFLPEGEDPDSLVRREGAAAFEQRLQQALPLSDYLFQRLAEGLDLASVDDRARLAERARPLLGTMPAGTFRDLLQQQLEQRLQVPLQLLAGHTRAPRWPQQPLSDNQVRRTLPRYAIALLLARPALARQVAAYAEPLRAVAVPGLALLAELIDLLNTNPHIRAGSIVEHYRGSETADSLARLTATELELDDALYEAEFLGVMRKLQQIHLDRQLYDKAARGELTPQEMELLRRKPACSTQYGDLPSDFGG